MALRPGERIGPYEIVSQIGSGGMGEVYRARDPRLSRDVALKTLPEEVLRSPDGLSRFLDEARSASALNHPGIVTVHDFGQDDGKPYLVMELLEGESLGARISRGPLPPREAIGVAVQVAEALAAAHARGIVHRDLKPDNVYLAPDGRAKVLDFGLARRSAVAPLRPELTRETRLAQTTPGLVVGTCGYMSPEQVRGEPVDARTDVFALGAVLWEAVTGRWLFTRGTPAETMSAVLHEDPPELAGLVKSPPPGLERLILRCLEKDPARRFQSAHDLAFALDAVGSASVVRSVAEPAAAPSRRRPWRRLLLAGGAIAAAAAVLATATWLARREPPPAVPEMKRLTFSRGSIRSARFAPDGESVVFGAAWDGHPIRLHVTQPGSPEPQRVELPDADVLSVSTKGEMALSLGRRYLSLFNGVGTLARAPLAGRAPREVLESVQEADWGPDGEALAVVRDVGGRNRLEYPIGTVLLETEGWFSHPRVSPDGERVAFADHPIRWDDRGSVAVVTRGRRGRTLLSGVWQSVGGVAWGPAGKEVWYSAAPEGAGRELRSVSLAGKDRPLLRVSGNLTLHDVGKDGRALVSDDKWRRRVFYRAPGASRDLELSWLDWTYPRSVSGDWSKLLFEELGDGGGKDYSVYLRGTDGSPAVRLGRGSAFALSPDGRWALSATLDSPSRLVLLPTGAGAARPLTQSALDHRVASFLPDGRTLVFGGAEGSRRPRLYLLDVEGGAPRPVTPEGVVFAAGAALPVSPDGRAVLAAGPDGVPAVYPLDGTPPRPLPRLAPDESALGWGTDSRSVHVLSGPGLPARVVRLDLATGARAPLLEVFPPDPAGVVAVNPILVRADGAAVVYGTPQILSDLYLVTGLR